MILALNNSTVPASSSQQLFGQFFSILFDVLVILCFVLMLVFILTKPGGRRPDSMEKELGEHAGMIRSLSSAIKEIQSTLSSVDGPQKWDDFVFEPVSGLSRPELVKELYTIEEVYASGKKKLEDMSKEFANIFFTPLLKRRKEIVAALNHATEQPKTIVSPVTQPVLPERKS